MSPLRFSTGPIIRHSRSSELTTDSQRHWRKWSASCSAVTPAINEYANNRGETGCGRHQELGTHADTGLAIAAEFDGLAPEGVGNSSERPDQGERACCTSGVLGAVRSVKGGGMPVVGFGSHVDVDLLGEARQAGCVEVMARSRFFADPAGALGQHGTFNG